MKRTPATLVLNKTADPERKLAALQGIQFTANAKLVEIKMLEGRPHHVVPMVMLVEGVHNGSNGPLYYPKEELAKTPEVWNHKPVVVYHPTVNGQGVSACSPDILDTYKIGVILNAQFDKLGRLTAEAWIEESLAQKVDSRVMNAINAKKILELSTGLFTDNDMTPGTWEGEPYTSIARNYRPDHLAVLPDQTGACSVSKGAGFLRNEEGSKLSTDVKTLFASAEAYIRRQMGIVDNELSNDNVRSQLWKLIRAKLYPNYTYGSSDPSPDVWMEDVYASFFVYSHLSKLWKLGYSSNGTTVTLSTEDPVEVVRVTEYRTPSGTFVGNDQTHPSSMNKTAIIAALLANAATGFTKNDESFLQGLPDAQLKKLATTNGLKEDGTPVAPPAAAPAPEAAPTGNGLSPAQNEALRYGERVLAQNKANAIAAIKKNPNNSFADAALNSMDIDTLENLAKLAAVPANNSTPPSGGHNFGGQAPVAPTGNSSGGVPVLEPPTMNFGPDANK